MLKSEGAKHSALKPRQDVKSWNKLLRNLCSRWTLTDLHFEDMETTGGGYARLFIGPDEHLC